MSSKPTFNLIRTCDSQPVMKGGNPDQVPKTDEYYLHKAKKYHMKCQQKLKAMQAQGKAIPAGYEKYLSPFSAQ